VPVGDCERAFQDAAAADGVVLVRARLPWLNQRGHFGLPDPAASVLPVMDQVFGGLGGDQVAQQSKRLTPLPGDFQHQATGLLIEVDETQHFTSYRNLTLSLYPSDARLGFDLCEYQSLCREWSARSDRYRRNKDAVGFGEGGRARQRAYHDALRDLVAPIMGHPPVIRAHATDSDGAAAYRRVRERLWREIECQVEPLGGVG
jgi:hypothetical protein